MNPRGVATYGFIVSDQDGRPIGKGSGVVGEGEGIDHMVAEYEAVLHALRFLLEENRTQEPLEVQNDNEQLILELKGKKEIGTGSYQSRYFEAKKLASLFPEIEYCKISGDINWQADCLAWKEYRQYISRRNSVL